MAQTDNRQFDKITVKYTPKMVQITCDSNLKSYLKEKGNGAVKLAAHILDQYEKAQGAPLKISIDSLAIEILGHTYTDTFSAALAVFDKQLPSSLRRPLDRLADQIQHHTEIIDCGEAEVDSNRWVWDTLSKYKSIIYKMMGDLA